MSKEKERVLVAMSGGVDSSAAAALLVKEGYEVLGVTLRFWACNEASSEKACCGIDQVARARAAADRLEFPHYIIDCRKRFEEKVLRYAWNEYDRGRTPNPCIMCNEHIKFGLLRDKARALDARRIATGHHARVLRTGDASRPLLCRGRDRQKDQSYFLCSLSPDQLDMSLLPIGDFTKDEVRGIARELGLPNADTPESQDACLSVEGHGFAESLRRRFGARARPGTIVEPSGRTLGGHEGIHRFTIGQRRGLGVALGRPAYVQAIRPERREVVVSSDEHLLRAAGLEASGVRWFVPPEPGGPLETQVQIRYRHAPVGARIEEIGRGKVRIRFSKPQRAVAPGQAVVFYDGDVVRGGGWIERVLHEWK